MFKRHERGKNSWIGRKSDGPLIVIGESIADAWTGHHGEDLERAKAIEDYLAVVPVGESEALVLGDEPFETTWVPLPRSGGGMFVRRLWSNTPDDALRAARGIGPDEWTFATFMDVRADRLLLFDAARPGTETAAAIVIDLPRGKYAISTADAQPDDETCVMAHRLLPIV